MMAILDRANIDCDIAQSWYPHCGM